MCGNIDALDDHFVATKVHYGPYAQKHAAEKSRAESKFFSEWNCSEDLALTKPLSKEFAIILKTKGANEIERRKLFLQI